MLQVDPMEPNATDIDTHTRPGSSLTTGILIPHQQHGDFSYSIEKDLKVEGMVFYFRSKFTEYDLHNIYMDLTVTGPNSRAIKNVIKKAPLSKVFERAIVDNNIVAYNIKAKFEFYEGEEVTVKFNPPMIFDSVNFIVDWGWQK